MQETLIRKIPHAVEQLSPCTTTIEPVLWSPEAAATEAWVPRACVPQQQKPSQWEACALQLESSPHLLQLKKSPLSNEDPAQSKINKQRFFFKKKN